MNTFSNTGNIPTLHQPTVTVITVTHTHWLPTVAHLPQVWLLALNALGVNARENVSLGMYVYMYVSTCIYRVLLLHHPLFLRFSIPVTQLCGTMP